MKELIHLFSISITSQTPIVLATIDFSVDPLVLNNSSVWLTAAIEWQALAGEPEKPIFQFSNFNTDPTVTPIPVPIYRTRDQAENSFDEFGTICLTHVDVPGSSNPKYYLTANISPLNSGKFYTSFSFDKWSHFYCNGDWPSLIVSPNICEINYLYSLQERRFSYEHIWNG